mgnify:CR=1 FL=1
MKTFRVVPQISCCDTFREFADHFQVGNGDILVTNRRRYEKYVKPAGVAIPVLFREDYGKGEPTDEMIDAMGRDMKQYDVKRIIAFGGGTIVDMCKCSHWICRSARRCCLQEMRLQRKYGN